MDFLASTAAGKVVDHISFKFSDCIKNFKGQYDDIELADAIRQELLDQCGNELFYNDLDSYPTEFLPTTSWGAYRIC